MKETHHTLDLNYYFKNLRTSLTNLRDGIRLYHPIQLTNNHILSIQASAVHYCTPQRLIYDVNQYTHFEVSILNENDEFTGEINDPNIMKQLEFYRYDDKHYGYVPRELIVQIIVGLNIENLIDTAKEI